MPLDFTLTTPERRKLHLYLIQKPYMIIYLNMDPKPLLVGPQKSTVSRWKAFLNLILNLGLVCLWTFSEMGSMGLKTHQKALLFTIYSLNMDPKPLLYSWPTKKYCTSLESFFKIIFNSGFGLSLGFL